MFSFLSGKSGKKPEVAPPPTAPQLKQASVNPQTPEQTKLISLIMSTNEQLAQAINSIKTRGVSPQAPEYKGPGHRVMKLVGSSSSEKMPTAAQDTPLTEQERVHFMQTILDVLRKRAAQEKIKLVAQTTDSLRIKIRGELRTLQWSKDDNVWLLQDLAKLVNKSLDEDPAVSQMFKDRIDQSLKALNVRDPLRRLVNVYKFFQLAKSYGTDVELAVKAAGASSAFTNAVSLALDPYNNKIMYMYIAVNTDKFARLLLTSYSILIEKVFRTTLPLDTRIEILERMALYPLNSKFYVCKQEMASVGLKLDQIRAEKIRQMESGSGGLQSTRPESSLKEVELWSKKIASMETFQKLVFSETLSALSGWTDLQGASSSRTDKIKKEIEDLDVEIAAMSETVLSSGLSNDEKVSMLEGKVRLLSQKETLLLHLDKASATGVKRAKSRFEEDEDVYRRFLIFAGLIENSPLSSFEKCDWDCMSLIVDQSESLPEAQFIWTILESRRNGNNISRGDLRKRLVNECVQYCRQDREYLSQAIRFFEGINAAISFCFSSMVVMKEQKDKEFSIFIEHILTKCQGKPLSHYEIMTSLFQTGIPTEEREELISLVAAIPISLVEGVQKKISSMLESGKRWADIRPRLQDLIAKNPVTVNTLPLEDLIRSCRKSSVVYGEEKAVEGCGASEEESDENIGGESFDHPFILDAGKGSPETKRGTPTQTPRKKELETSTGSFQLERLVSSLSTYEIEKLKILGSADVATLSYLREFGSMEAQAQAEFAAIQKDPLLYEYYTTFSRILSSKLRSNQVIDSTDVEHAEQTTAEQVLSVLQETAQSSNIPFLPMVTGAAQFFLSKYEGRERTIRVHKIAQSFPIEKIWMGLVDTLALKTTLLQQEQIREEPISDESSIQQFFGYIEATLGWLSADDIDTSAKKLAATHVTNLLNCIMKSEVVVMFGKEHLPQLIAMATGRNIEEVSGELQISQTTISPTSVMVSSNNSSPQTASKGAVVDPEAIKELERRVHAQSQQMKDLEKRLPPPKMSLGSGGLVLAPRPGTESFGDFEEIYQGRIQIERRFAEMEKQVILLTEVVIGAGLGNL